MSGSVPVIFLTFPHAVQSSILMIDLNQQQSMNTLFIIIKVFFNIRRNRRMVIG